MSAPLSHLRVLDLSRVLAGPWSSQLLADLGAEVIKVERPGEGDDTRAWGPPFLKAADGAATRESAYYLSTNRGKRSVTIDIGKPEGQALVRRLAACSDVVIENYKVGGLKRYRLDYESLKAVKPDLVYCSITGFGQDGPYANRPGYDLLVQAMGGLMSFTGEPDGEPMKTGVAIADVFTGMYATVAILAALAHRDRTGEGQRIDLALLDVTIAMTCNQASNYLVGGMVPKRRGNAHPTIVPYQAFASSDGYVILAVGNDGQFARFCEVAGCPGLAEDERFRTNAGRVNNREALLPIVKGIMAGRTIRAWMETLDAAGVPCGPINSLDAVFEDPQVRHRGVAVTMPHPLAGNVTLVANPIRLSATPISYDRPPPLLGENTEDVLAGVLGLDAAAIARLREDGAI